MKSSSQDREVVRRVGRFGIALLPSAPYSTSHLTTCCSLGFSLDSQAGVHAIATDVKSPFRVRANTFAWLPNECDVYSSSDRGGEYLLISLSDPLGGQHWQTDVLDELAAHPARRLRAALILQGDDLELEHFASVLLDRFASVRDNRYLKPSNWMTEKRLRRVDEIIWAGLAANILVADLARELGLSPGYFSRAFRAATGRSPQQHIIDHRLRHARTLIASTRMPLTDVAMQCGFSSHAHMSTHFRRWLGVAPSDLRPERRRETLVIAKPSRRAGTVVSP